MTQSSMPTEPLKSGFLSKRNDPLCRLRFAGGIFTVSRPTGSWMKSELIKLMRHCFWSCRAVKYNCSYEKTNTRCLYDYN